MVGWRGGGLLGWWLVGGAVAHVEDLFQLVLSTKIVTICASPSLLYHWSYYYYLISNNVLVLVLY